MIRTTLLTSLLVSTFALAEGPSAEVTSGVSTSEPSPKAYVSVFAGTTLLTRGGAGDLAGPSRDFTPMVGAATSSTTPGRSSSMSVPPSSRAPATPACR